MRKLCALLLAAILVCASLCACEGNKTNNSLIGYWTCTVEEENITILFNDDGTGHLSAIGGLVSYNFNYTVEEGKITFDAENDIFQGKALDFTLEDNKLTLSNDDEFLEFIKEES